MGRRPIGEKAMTGAERARRYHARHRVPGPWDHLPSLEDVLKAAGPELAPYVVAEFEEAVAEQERGDDL